ncbi:MAG: NUDIX domain-containing protein [Chloroflexota bacterium]
MKFEKYLKLINKHPNLFIDDDSLIKIIIDKDVIRNWQIARRKELVEMSLPQEWADIGVVLDDPYNIIVRDLVRFPDGNMNGYGRSIATASLDGGKGVVILPEYQGKILLLHQYRHPTRQWHYHVPLGFGEPNISAEENARKEIAEEVEGEIEEMVSLGELYPNVGYEAVPAYLFYAKLAKVGLANLNEGIESFAWVTIKELENWIADGKINCGYTISAYTRAKLKGLI